MAGWSKQKRLATEKAFYQFLDNSFVFSKEKNRFCVGKNLYPGQRRLISEIFDALEADIHHIYILKSRQLGISTIIRLLTTFLIGLNPGLNGAIIFDDDKNKVKSRTELVNVITELPKRLKFPAIKDNNRYGLILQNKAEILFMSAGTRKSKSSGGLGRSVGLSFLHASELCSWADGDGIEALKQSLAENNDDRLYIWESTARGFNLWFDLWLEAKKDKLHCRTIFLGWWSHSDQRIPKTHRDFLVYGAQEPTEIEQKKIDAVWKQYGVKIDMEQLAWVRRKYDPTARADNDNTEVEYEASTSRTQEQPWTEEDAFQQSGAIFFSNEKLTDQTNAHVSKKYQAFMCLVGQEFVDMRILRAENMKSIELKVWEEPVEDGVYAIGCDPAYGENPDNDRSSIQVFRCYADGCTQVSEYCYTMINTRQLAWVLASLLGWYGKYPGNEIRYILELNGAGTAVWNELRSLKQQIELGYAPLAEEQGLKNIFRNVQAFINTKPDSLGAGQNWHIKTSTQSKIADLETLRDFVSNGQLHIQSADLIDEMKTITREAATIKAAGTKHDDRVLAAAFALRCWVHKLRPMLVAKKLTRAAAEAKSQLRITDQVFLFNQNSLDSFFKSREAERNQQLRIMRRQAWRGRR
jgi:hypothetical protein